MVEIRVPTLGESVTEATIGRWFKQPGEKVAVDEPVVELETDKVTIEVPAPAAGVLSDIAAKDGSTVAVGALLGRIEEGAGAAASPTGGPGAAGESGAGRGAAGAVGAQARGRERHRRRRRAGQRPRRARHQGRHAGGDRACRRAADAGAAAGGGCSGAGAVA